MHKILCLIYLHCWNHVNKDIYAFCVRISVSIYLLDLVLTFLKEEHTNQHILFVFKLT